MRSISNNAPAIALSSALLGVTGAGCQSIDNNPPQDSVSAAQPERISANLAPVQGFAARYIGSWAPWTTEVSSTPPASITKLPAHSPDAVFGEFSFGDGTRYRAPATPVGFMLDESRERFIIDSNRNGDLTDDHPASWMVERRPVMNGEKTAGTVTVRSDVATSSAPDANSWSVALFFPDPATRKEFNVEHRIDRYRDYATKGYLELDGRHYEILLDDGAVTGDFSHTKESPRIEIELLVDVNGNGRYDHRGESFTVSEPFTINGITYEIASISRDGTRIELIRSDKSVPEVPPPPDLKAGSIMPSFTVTTIEGKQLRVPQDLRGQIVLLDFWASWCGPCIGELPNLSAVYQEFKDKGFTIVSVSIDEEDKRQEALDLIGARNLGWVHAFDSGGWQGEIIAQFCPAGIPAGYLFNATTGELIATGDKLRGQALRSTVHQALEIGGKDLE
ncbi:MAG: TlpA disulfide reductase family protein [Bdellovibrionota bacterium]|nr:MAG: TlpA disulfide reductase family protein [Bdellovibrionota bacterium]